MKKVISSLRLVTRRVIFILLLFLISFCLIFSSGTVFSKKVPDKTPEEYYHIDTRVVLGGSQAFNIGNVIGPIASIAKKYCKDKLDEKGNVVEEGYFRYSATTNYFRVEVDKESGYAIGEGKVVIHYEKKCPGYLAAKAFKNSGDLVATITAKGRVGKDGKIHGNADIRLSIPTLVTLKLNFSDSWDAQYTQSFVGPSVFSINVAKFGFSADFPITVSISPLESPQLIEFEIVKEEGKPAFVPPTSKEMTADGEDSQTFTVSMEQKAVLTNKKNGDIIDDSYEGGVEGEEFVLRTRVKQIKPGKDTPNYGDIDKLKSTCDGSSCDNLSLTTDKEGKATFVYKPPKIEDEEFTGADVSFRAISSKGEPELKIKVYPKGGIIKGKLVSIHRQKFLEDVRANLRHPVGSGIANENKDIKAGEGEFSFETKIPGRGYNLTLRPTCQGCLAKQFTNLPYIIDLGNVVLGTITDYEWEAKRDILALFDKSGMRDILGDFMDKLEFKYGDGPSYKNGIVYLPSENFMMDANGALMRETIYHEIIHGVHSKLAEHGWWYTATKLGGEHDVWMESHERLAFDEALSHFFARLAMLEKGEGYDPGENYSRRSIDSDNTNKNGNTTEGKVVAFLLDYYKYKKLKPNQILGDLFQTMRSYGEIPDMGTKKPTQTIAEWILTKLWMDPTDRTLNALMNKHNIRLDTVENIDWGRFTIVKSDMNGRRTEAERQKSLQDKQRTTSSNQTKTHSVKTGDNVGKNTTYKAQGDTSYAIEDNGQCELNSGTVVARNGGAVNTTEARVVPAGTVYSVTALDDKTIVKVAEGEVEIFNTQTWESYLAEAGEEVEVYDDKIEVVSIFDPKVEPEFKRGFMDYFHEYFSWMNLLILAGVIVVLIIVIIIIKKILKRSKK